MTVDTKNAAGRRELHFSSLQDVRRDAEQIAAGKARTIGNWTIGQIFMHLARSFDMSIDGADFRVSWPVQLMARWLMKKRALRGPLPSGFQLPSDAARTLVPGETTVEAGLKGLAEAIDRLASTDQRRPHPVFGPLSKDQWDLLHLRHAELHLSFIVPENG